MPTTFESAKATLSYPLYACDFDVKDATTIVVGGGGGAGKSGVGNKITVLKALNPYELQTTAEIDLSRDEDSVMSLAVGQGKGKETLVYAGINSSEQDRAKGNSQHFRVFGLVSSGGGKKGGKPNISKVSELSRSVLFGRAGKETYQRLIRLSKPFANSSQLGAAATAFGSDGEEVVLFDTSGSPSTIPQIRGRIHLDVEAEDVDILQTGSDEYLFVSCTKNDIFAKAVSSKTDNSEPRRITPPMAEYETETKPVLRSLRFLSPEFLVTITNLQGRNGAAMQVLRLPTSESDKISQATRTKLPSQVRQATGLAVCNLSPRTSPSDTQSQAQFLIAVAGQDMSISLYTVELQRSGSLAMISRPKLLRTLNDAHPFLITGLALSTFVPPKDQYTPQSIKLLSVSAGNTVVVHTIPVVASRESSTVRYIVAGATESVFTPNVVLTIIIALVFAFFAQLALEVRGSSPTLFGLSDQIAPDVAKWLKISHPIPNAVFGTPKPVISSTLSSSTSASTLTHAESEDQSFASLLEALAAQQGEQSPKDGKSPVIIIREHSLDEPKQGGISTRLKSSIKADLHDEDEHGPHDGKSWDELTADEKERWTKRLKDAGYWAEDYAETVLKGVFWGVIGAAVPAA